MNALTTTQNTPPARPTTPPLTPALSTLLDATGSPDEAVKAIVSAPELLAEVRTALPALQAVALAKAGPEGVYTVIHRRFSVYPQPKRSAVEWADWWADYYDVLADISLASLEAGMRAYVADPSSEFMPKPGRLRELAFLAPCRSLLRYQRAKRAVQAADEPVAVPGPPVDPSVVRSMLAEFNAKRMPDDPKRGSGPSLAGKVDAGGLTAQMRANRARRAEEGL